MAKKAVFAASSRINHDKFGTGTILDVNERHTTILFDENGERKFITDMVVLEHSDTPAPKKPVRRKKTAK